MRVWTLDLRGRLIVRLSSGEKAFVKLYRSDYGSDMRRVRALAARERICLSTLKGLAVPRLIKLGRKELAGIIGFDPGSFVAQTYLPGKSLRAAGLDSKQIIGAWLFLAEQLAAFRRHQILYTDIKSSNVLATKNPLRIIQIDFNFATLALPGHRYRSTAFGYTAGYKAPEHGIQKRLTEAAVVYQLGMLLARSWGLHSRALEGTPYPLAKLVRGLRKAGAPALGEIVQACLHDRPARRPRDYNAVLRRIKAAVRAGGLPDESVRIWKSLREPYQKRLAGLGFTI